MNYYARRFLTMLLTVLFVAVLTFTAFRIVPGNPALTILGAEATNDQVEQLEARLGIDKPLAQQFAEWLGGVAVLDFGESLRFSEPVLSLIASRFPVTLSLAILSLAITVATAVPLGIFAAKSRGRAADIAISVGTQLGLAVPSFWMGILLILIFALTLKWFSISTFVPWSESPLLHLKSIALPSVALAVPQIAIIVRYLRTSMLEQLNLEYVRTARSKGLSERAIQYRHVLKNALLPVITIIGIQFGELLAGSLVVEQVFTLPGLGSLLITAIGNRDYPLVQGMVLLIALMVILINFIVDLSYRWLDPKIRLK